MPAAQRQRYEYETFHPIRDPAILKLVNEALAALEFPAAVVSELAHRAHYADAVFNLACVAERKTTSAILPQWLFAYNRRFLPSRLGVELGIVAKKSNYIETITADDLTKLAHGKSSKKAELAKIALAALGEPQAPWPDLSKRERAALLLHHVIAYRRESL